VDEATKVKYLSRAILEVAVRPNVPRAFIYQLVDHIYDPQQLDRQAHFGLVDHDLRRKPSFFAVRNMLHILCDQAFAGRPGALDLELGGERANLRSLLMQQNNGVYYLALWLEAQSIRRSGVVRIAPQKVNIGFGERMRRVQVFRPADPASDLANGSLPRARLFGARTLTLDVADHPLILELVPRGVQIPGPVTGCTFTGT
jgi:hypothetical protein